MYSHPVLQSGRIAVITGGSSGIGLATAKKCAALGMTVVIADLEAPSITSFGFPSADASRVSVVQCDVTDLGSVTRLHAHVVGLHRMVHLLFLNAGITGGGGFANLKQEPNLGHQNQTISKEGTDLKEWKHVVDVNMWGVLNFLNVFAPGMIAQSEESVIAVTGSRAAVTCPPGAPTSYLVSKAAVKIITESLQHQLRNAPNCKVTAHLLLPGMTNTNIYKARITRMQGVDAAAKITASDGTNVTMGNDAVMPSAIADVLLTAIEHRSFYAIASDGEQSKTAFKEAVKWSAEDIVEERVPLSRWHQPYRQQFLDLVAKL